MTGIRVIRMRHYDPHYDEGQSFEPVFFMDLDPMQTVCLQQVVDNSVSYDWGYVDAATEGDPA